MHKQIKQLTIKILGLGLLLWAALEYGSYKATQVLSGFAGGSYPYAESWDLDASETEILEAINEIKNQEHDFPQILITPRDTGYIWNSPDMLAYKEKLKVDSLTPLPEKNNANYKNDFWLFIDFTYPNSKETVHTWTRPNKNSTTTTFALVSLSNSDEPQNHKRINDDFWFLSNKLEIWKFKRLILNKIQDRIDPKRQKQSL